MASFRGARTAFGLKAVDTALSSVSVRNLVTVTIAEVLTYTGYTSGTSQLRVGTFRRVFPKV